MQVGVAFGGLMFWCLTLNNVVVRVVIMLTVGQFELCASGPGLMKLGKTGTRGERSHEAKIV